MKIIMITKKGFMIGDIVKTTKKYSECVRSEPFMGTLVSVAKTVVRSKGFITELDNYIVEVLTPYGDIHFINEQWLKKISSTRPNVEILNEEVYRLQNQRM